MQEGHSPFSEDGGLKAVAAAHNARTLWTSNVPALDLSKWVLRSYFGGRSRIINCVIIVRSSQNNTSHGLPAHTHTHTHSAYHSHTHVHAHIRGYNPVRSGVRRSSQRVMAPINHTPSFLISCPLSSSTLSSSSCLLHLSSSCVLSCSS